jgi:peptidoglycan/LPS O-acetylase OafA/YrhL
MVRLSAIGALKRGRGGSANGAMGRAGNKAALLRALNVNGKLLVPDVAGWMDRPILIIKVDYRPDIDGLRAIAVISVVFFHANFPLFKGGFVGVDVFFVISGYLITSLILSEETVDFAFLKKFYERRIRRLLPPIIPVLLVTSALAYSQLNPDAMREYIKSLVAFLFFSSNWYFLNISGYFDGASHLKPLLHTWSLSVEEQFYILFPVSILLIKRFNKSAVPRFIFFVFVISLAFNIYLVSIKDLNGAFYNSIGRFWEIALGALIACGSIRSPSTSLTKDAFGIAGLAMIGVSIAFGTPTYPTLWTLVATIGTASVILAQGSKANRQLAAKPLVGVGLISYAFYLWHWPLFAFLNVANATKIHFALAILIAFALSVVSYVAVERPIRYRAPLVKSRRVFSAFACSMILFLSFGLAGIATNGFESRFSNRARDYERFLGKEEKQQKTAAMWGRCWMRGANDDFDAMIARCLSPPRGRPRILLAGDSHAAHFVSGFKRTLQGIDVDLLAVDTCSLTGMFLDGNRPTCLAIIRLIDNLKRGDFDAVFLSTQVVLSKNPVAAQKFLARIEQLTKITTVYVLGPIQYYRPNMPTIYMKSVGGVPDAEIGKLFDSAVHADPFEYDEMLKGSLAEISSVKYISLLDIMCPGKQCQHFDAAGWPILIDDSHLSVAASHDLVGRIAERIEISAKGNTQPPSH